MIGPWPGIEPGQTGWLGPGPAGRLFLRPPTLTAGNFAALWPTDPKFLALKDLNPFKTVSKVQKTSSILRVGFALSKWPHFNSAYLLRVPYSSGIAVYFFLSCCKNCSSIQRANRLSFNLYCSFCLFLSFFVSGAFPLNWLRKSNLLFSVINRINFAKKCFS